MTKLTDMKGFSPKNLKYMRRFAEECPTKSFGQQPADQLPWFQLCFCQRVSITFWQTPDTKER